MDNDETKALAEALGKPLGDAILIFIAVVNALRKQPAFDDAKFRAEIETLIARGDLTDIRRQAFLVLLSE
jgi:hypothetical protein